MARGKEIYGNHSLLMTPFKENGEVDEASAKRLIEFLIKKGVHGILALGTTGENFTLSHDETKAFMKFVVNTVQGRVPVGLGISSSSTSVSVELAKWAENIEAEYVFTTAPYYHPHRPAAIYIHFEAIGHALKTIPMMVYDGGAGIEFSLDLIKKIAEGIEEVKYVKVFVPFPRKIKQIADACGGHIQPWAGHDQLTYLMLRHGAKGLTSAASNVLPAEHSKMFTDIQEGNVESARKIFHAKVAPLNSVAFATALEFVQCYKHALYLMNIIDTPTCRKPLEPIDDTRKEELKEVMKYVGLI